MKDKFRRHLSPHFMLYEFVRSSIAIDEGIDNEPDRDQVKALTALCDNILEPLRQRFGPIVISSGFRSRRLNGRVGGAVNSQHMLGEAADIVVNTRQRAHDMYYFIMRNLDFDQLIWEPMGAAEPRWLHVSYTKRRKNRHMKL